MKKILYSAILSILFSCNNSIKLVSKDLTCEEIPENLNSKIYSNEFFTIKFPKLDTVIRSNNDISIHHIFPSDSSYNGILPGASIHTLIDTSSLSKIYKMSLDVCKTAKDAKVIDKGKLIINNSEYSWFLFETTDKYKTKPLRGIRLFSKKGTRLYQVSIVEFNGDNSICEFLPYIYTLELK